MTYTYPTVVFLKNIYINQKMVHTDQFCRVKTTIKQIVRDWSRLGERERSASYGPALDILNCEYPTEAIDRSKIKILTPGSGLGRITWELFSHGFHSEGCEFSWYMILASQFILNRCSADDVVFRIFPYIHETCNLQSWSDATTEATFPDVDLTATPEQGGTMEMGIGDFLDLYNEPAWHSVVTVFFVDTAHNIIEYVERIYKILLPGGLWVSFSNFLSFIFIQVIGK